MTPDLGRGLTGRRPTGSVGIRKISVSDYDSLDRIRSSQLKVIIDGSPKRLRYELDCDEEEPDSDAFETGRAFHLLVLEPHMYSKEVVVFRDGQSRKSVGYERFRARYPYKTILLEKEVPMVEQMAAAVLSDPLAKEYLAHVQPEMSVLWTDQETGIECRARLDGLDETEPATPIIVELKSSRDCGVDKFGRQANDLLYHLSWAMYRSGYMAVRGAAPELVTIVAEKEPPWDVVVYRVPEIAILAGEVLFREALTTLKKCRDSGQWVGKGGGIVQELKLPKWARGMPRDVGLDWS